MKVRCAILAAVAGVAVASSAQAQFTAYNDCQSSTGGNAAKTTLYGAGAGGPLTDFATGVVQTASVALVNNGGTPNGSGPTAEFTSGSPAANMFGGKVVNTGSVNYYGPTGWSFDLVFSNLTPGAKYTMATTVDRGNASPAPTAGYTNRWTVISLVGADSSTYASSAGAVKVSPTATSIQSYNTDAGYLAQWTDIAAGADNTFSVHFTNAVGINPVNGVGTLSSPYPAGATQDNAKAYGPAMFMLTAVPEPTSLSLLSLAVLPLLRRRRD